ncbi:ABC transporter substrate-binding protein [Parasphaerochaeta coccoides]|uniref:Extracellular solute-binding protein family 1 n=1 Tax=Parasphaerochaeta coccoides (strain ATCC BAA-1237 / DSM 17374 / SPN1) TaxID=760011 RepID=F4GLM7_PARC1|nr:ABC transporter substrate-binding protein [Parasphaerochaeta coccoides]AEC02421.1 extracellular solute-binding protein family 1 [Parasphaerochaeta coccoides DSM 17374]
MKKNLMLFLIVLVTMGTMFAGGGKESSKDSGSKTLRVSWWGSDSRHTPTLNAMAAYQRENPNVRLEGEYGGWDGYYQKLVTQIAGRTAADIIQIDQPWLNELSARGDVFVVLDRTMIDLDEFDVDFLNDYCTYNGKLLGLPTGINVNTFLVDVTLLADNGIDPDTVWTWENIITEGRKIHQNDPAAYFSSASPDIMRYWFEIYIAQLAGAVVNSNKQVAFTEEQGTQAFAYFKQWFDEGIVAPFSQTSLFYQKFHENPSWINGKTATAWDWVSSMDKAIGNKKNIETRQLPVMEGAKNTGVLMRPSQIMVVNNSSVHKDEAIKVLDYLFTNHEAIEILGTARGIPATVSGRRILAEKNQITALAEKATNDGIAQAGLPQSSWQMNSEVIQTMQDVIDEFGFGRLTPQQASAKMIANLTATLTNL